MCLFQYDDDPEPEEPDPAGLLYVPVRPGTRAVAVRVLRTPLGSRTAVGSPAVTSASASALASRKEPAAHEIGQAARTV
ncbi:hypothetical protein R1T08_05330 [Streptomyces sp. SBC-4]|nr:hypothetical protein [Streptomyces sp. SBC-4]MDV5143717.1 hypothetical protein [Streptomyces sp. SBC-4]